MSTHWQYRKIHNSLASLAFRDHCNSPTSLLPVKTPSTVHTRNILCSFFTLTFSTQTISYFASIQTTYFITILSQICVHKNGDFDSLHEDSDWSRCGLSSAQLTEATNSLRLALIKSLCRTSILTMLLLAYNFNSSGMLCYFLAPGHCYLKNIYIKLTSS